MSSRKRRWLRLLRLLVACLAFVIARPATPARSLDCVVLIAAEAPRSTLANEARSTAPRRIPVVRATPHRAVREGVARKLVRIQSTRVFRDRTYLRHCALLC